MRLIKCRKCGATIATDETFIQRMLDDINYLSEKARKDKRNCNSYLQQASAIRKIMQQYLHRTAQIDEESRRTRNELKFLVHYVLNNGLVSQDKLQELNDAARKSFEEKQQSDQEIIERLYGDFENISINRTRADPTEKQATRGEVKMANDLISRKALIADLRTAQGLGAIVAETLVRFVKKQPTVNTLEVVHGHMVERIVDYEYPSYKVLDCSECGCSVEKWHNYCPNCGAKMDGERKDNE